MKDHTPLPHEHTLLSCELGSTAEEQERRMESDDEEASEVHVSPGVPSVFQFKVEGFRLFTYTSFWLMCVFAFIVSMTTVKNYLGPCPLQEGDEPTYGMHCSDLQRTFGFNNICVYWDYSPARELTAMVYPIFEYSMVAYIIVNYLQIKNDFENQRIGTKIYKPASILLWVKLLFVAWFRMIFVVSVTQEPISIFGTEIPAVVGHTLGFFGMQFALILIAFEDIVYIFYKEIPMWPMSVKTTKNMSVLYLVLLIIVTALKISWASSIFVSGIPWFVDPWPHILDRVWLVLAAVMPFLFAIHGVKNEPPMVITVLNEG